MIILMKHWNNAEKCWISNTYNFARVVGYLILIRKVQRKSNLKLKIYIFRYRFYFIRITLNLLKFLIFCFMLFTFLYKNCLYFFFFGRSVFSNTYIFIYKNGLIFPGYNWQFYIRFQKLLYFKNVILICLW